MLTFVLLKKKQKMNFLDIIFERRSIRKYKKDQQIDNKTIDLLLEAAMSAPSARNLQPWHFVVCQDKKSLEQLSTIHPYGSMLSGASLAILICGDSQEEQTESYIIQDCAAATQNMLLATHGLGLGGVWLGVFPREKRIQAISSFFKLPDNIIPVSLVCIGVADEKKSRNQNFVPSKVHYETW